MSLVRVPHALEERLGAEATQAFSAVLETARAEWMEDVVTLAGERFARGMTEESALLRREVAQEITTLRVDLARELSDLRQDLGRHVGDVRQDLGTARVELFKWCFLFWIGQVAATAGLIAFMLRPGT